MACHGFRWDPRKPHPSHDVPKDVLLLGFFSFYRVGLIAEVERPATRYRDRVIVPASGVDLMPYLNGSKPKPRLPGEWMAFELMGNAYLIDGDFKVMRQRTGMWGDGQWHLFNIVKDPGETQRLDPKEPERLKQMVQRYDLYAKDKGIVPVADDWNPWSAFGQSVN